MSCCGQYKQSNVEEGRTIAQAVSHRLLTAQARVCSQGIPCGINGGQSGTGTRFSWESFGFPPSISFYRCSIFTRVSSGGWTMGPLAGAVPQRHSLTIITIQTRLEKCTEIPKVFFIPHHRRWRQRVPLLLTMAQETVHVDHSYSKGITMAALVSKVIVAVWFEVIILSQQWPHCYNVPQQWHQFPLLRVAAVIWHCCAICPNNDLSSHYCSSVFHQVLRVMRIV
jgi:hypothetical protein